MLRVNSRLPIRRKISGDWKEFYDRIVDLAIKYGVIPALVESIGQSFKHDPEEFISIG